MSTKANPAAIGSFIAAGLAMGVGGVILFSSGDWFTKTQQYILYFDASVQGLNAGAPVKFRGVPVGSVVDLWIHHNQAEDDTHMPVIIELNESLLRKKTGLSIDLSDTTRLEALVKRGLRGKLEAQSLVTGLLYVELEIQPDPAPARFHQLKPLLPEIPTAPTRVQAILQNLAELDVKGLMDRLNSILDRLDSSLAALNVAEINAGLTNVLASVEQLASSPDLTNVFASLSKAVDEYRQLGATLRGKLDPLADGANGVLKDARLAIADLRGALRDVHDLLAPEAPLQQDLTITLEELAEAARSVNALADFLTRHPNALISGRKQPELKP